MSNLHRRAGADRHAAALHVNPLYSGLISEGGVPRYRLPDGPMHPDAALAIIRDELMLDGNARLNLATFSTTWMEPQAKELIGECLDRNMVDREEYPQVAELEGRCVNMLSELWHDPGQGIGCSTAGSSEAAMLGGLAMKFAWRRRRGGAGGRPNLVIGTNTHVCWPKFCRYWDVEPRWAPIRRRGGPSDLRLDPEDVVSRCDADTIGVVAVLGSTQTGAYDPVADIAAALDRLEAERGLDVPLHVDAAGGGFVAPFLQPGLAWDFRLPRVRSINASGHKFGLVYPAVGWVVWQDAADLPGDLVLHTDVLGGPQETFTLNFSRSGAPIAAQYYNFLRLGFDGYRAVQRTCQDVARHLAAGIAGLGGLEPLTDGGELPAFAVRTAADLGCTAHELSDRLRRRGWQVPAYHLPPALEEIPVLRFVVRNGFSFDIADRLLADLRDTLREVRGPGRPASRQPLTALTR
ncbi:glutamate decarboxylase [Actinomadura sp. ATCC 31491]|uniref:Glutamate decarboxylase n=1 Tax=Actinomadura luzonensis TaxID=2805427 RepID=A0ABT0FSU9_9ACTN|nr:glutamate decarboxylase [Actinomadura luzonensis]MCK2215410.1 glutamate decarboxylase [Actinomadura luzonensis]